MGSVVEMDWASLDQRNEERFVQILDEKEVIIRGHFTLTSGRHADTYVNIKGLYPHTRTARDFGRALAHRIERELGPAGLLSIAGVVAPAMGGVILAHDTADWIGTQSQDFDREVLALFAEKVSNRKDDGKRFVFNRGYDEFIAGRRFVVVEDVMTTGGSVLDLVELVREHGGEVVLVCAIWVRGDIGSEDVGGVPMVSLINRTIPTYSVEECRVEGPCSQEIPMNTKHGTAGRKQRAA